MPRPVLTKKDFVRRYQAGEFGNRSPTWSVREWKGCRHGVMPLYHLRNKTAGGETFYNLTAYQIDRRIRRIKQAWDNWYISKMAPTEHTLIQGEVQRTVRGLYLRYTRVKQPMRDALATQQDHAWLLTAKMLLVGAMDPSSFEWLGYLLDTYPDHVIEFSTYGVNWGTVPGVNTVWWEVRRY